ncbi:MAG TPA: FGGY family carbohydrate kinase, partial [Leifsonia sp.]
MTSASHAALGVDVGTTNTKVVLIRVTDGSVQEERIHSLSTPASAAELRDAVLGAIRRVATDAPLPVRAIGIASMAETGALLDPDGEPLGDLLRWDAGDTAEADALVASVGAAELYAATGVPIAAKSPLVHWRSLAAAGDARLRTARWCGIADLVAVALTGSYATDRTLAARTMAYRHGGARGAEGDAAAGFDPDLLALAGLDSARFPRILRPGEPAGTLSARVAASLGLTPGIPVTIAGHDHAVGAWAAGARRPGDTADSVGTAEALYRVAAHVPRERARAAGFSVAPAVDGAHEAVLAGNPTAGAFVEWALRTLLPSADPRAAFDAAAAAASAGPSRIVVLPYLRGRQAPCPDAHATPRVVALSGPGAGRSADLPADPGAALAAVLTGLVLQLAWLDAEQTAVLSELRADDLPVLGGPGA